MTLYCDLQALFPFVGDMLSQNWRQQAQEQSQ